MNQILRAMCKLEKNEFKDAIRTIGVLQTPNHKDEQNSKKHGQSIVMLVDL
jgi:hypothetical protein